jgi:hypothetical protein
MPDQPDYRFSDLKRGDLVLLRWTGDRRIPNREGGSWAVVYEVKGNRAEVIVCGYGTTRYITAAHIERVDRKVKHNTYEKAAARVKAPFGTRLAAIS